MQVETHNALRDHHVLEATEVVVRNDDGTPVAVLQDHGNGVIGVYTAGDPNFNRALAALGITAQVQVKELRV